MELKLFVWSEFMPDYSDGLAFAIAETEEEAKEMIAKERDDDPSYLRWGPVEVKELKAKYCYWVNGGS